MYRDIELLHVSYLIVLFTTVHTRTLCCEITKKNDCLLYKSVITY